jgi:DNA-binding transcriptional ArsR family regulator
VQAILDAISSPRRRAILHLIWEEERSAGDIARQFDVSWPAISQNISVLRKAGLVTERREANHRYYRADQRALGSLEAALQDMWAHDLGRLRSVVEES